MVFSKLRNIFLFCAIILCADNIIHPPFITGCCGKHAAHQMITSIRMVERMQCIIFVHSEFIGRNKYGSARSQRNVTCTISNGSGSHSCCRIVSGSGYNFYLIRYAEFLRQFRKQRSNFLITFVYFWKPACFNTADLTHFF